MITFQDLEYDFREDSKCGDPDSDSKKLYNIHQILWSKLLPKGDYLELVVSGNSGRILLQNNLTENLSSDRMCPHFVGRYKGRFDGWISQNQGEEFQRKVRTFGGHIVFPAHRKNGFTINQARGVNGKICDRFDLTLECIRRFYIGQNSPLSESLNRYSDFLNLFQNFSEYVDFFLLNDFLKLDNQIDFAIPFDNFERKPLPETPQEYQEYIDKTSYQITQRNLRIMKEVELRFNS